MSRKRPQAGTVHVAPPSCHLLVAPGGALALSHADRVNFCRPAVDVLFRSLADVHGMRAIGVVLTGMGRDGAHGIAAIRRRGGLTMAQDDATAEAPGMPSAAIDIGRADMVLPLDRIAAALTAAASLEEGGGTGTNDEDNGARQGSNEAVVRRSHAYWDRL